MGPTSYSSYYNYVLTNPQKGIWSFTIADMINPQKGIDLMNNTSIIIRIHFAVTLFQHSPLTRRVFYNSIRRERGQHHQRHQVSERTALSTASWNTGWHIYKSSKVFLIINTAQRLEHHQHSMELE
jgi:hypothetical protein